MGGIGCVPVLVGGLDRLTIYLADVVIHTVLVVIVDPQFLPVGCVHPHQPVDRVVVVAVVHSVDQVLVPQGIAVGIKLVAEGGVAVVVPLDLSAVFVVVELDGVPIAVGGGVKQAVVGQVGVAAQRLGSHLGLDGVAKGIVDKAVLEAVVQNAGELVVLVLVAVGHRLSAHLLGDRLELVVAGFVGVVCGIPIRVGDTGEEAVVRIVGVGHRLAASVGDRE